MLLPGLNQEHHKNMQGFLDSQYMCHKTTWWPHLVSDHIIDYNYISSVYELSTKLPPTKVPQTKHPPTKLKNQKKTATKHIT